MKMNQQGFTLFEVLISIFIAAVAILGLVMLELKILRSSQSSFNYTIATIEANTLADKIWINLCEIKGTSSPNEGIYSNVYNQWVSAVSNAKHTSLTGATSASPGTFLLNDVIVVSWKDKNFEEDLENDRVLLSTSYPDFSGKCQ